MGEEESQLLLATRLSRHCCFPSRFPYGEEITVAKLQRETFQNYGFVYVTLDLEGYRICVPH
ncbi:MAG: hypothetical protein SVX43_19105 [Cyanobacteriota bacterium]|nr:hypothetical protein [Cyanobacteriota bacterium]